MTVRAISKVAEAYKRDKTVQPVFRPHGDIIAALRGIPVVLVDPRNTSRSCPECGMIDKRNRPNQASFRCIGCGFASPADTIAAGNIARRADVNPPDAGSAPKQAPASSAL